MEGTEPWAGCEDARRGPGDLYGVTFKVWGFPWLVFSWTYWGTLQLSQPHFIPGQDITIAARSTLNEPNVLWGMEDGLIYDFTFDNVVIAGEKIDSLDQFYHNEFVLPLIIP